MSQIDNLVQICQDKLKEGSDLEDILRFLRQEGCSKGRSITILLKMKYLPPEKIKFTKHLVHFSKTWSDFRERDEEWHEKIIEILEAEDL